MSVALLGPGRPMLIGPNKTALWGPLRGSSGSGAGTVSGSSPSGISGLGGWWDAGTIAALLDASGNPIVGSGAAVGSLADKSGAGSPLTVFWGSGSGTRPLAQPRVSGLLGGVGRNTCVPPTLPSGVLLPALDPDQGYKLGSVTLGSGAAWSLWVVWSRPNWRQASGRDSAAIPILSLGSTVILAVDSAGGLNRLLLFPGASQTVIASSMSRRHTHGALLIFTPGYGVEVLLDTATTPAVANGANPLASSVTAPLYLLHDMSVNGAAQCFFHEAAYWPRALASNEITTLQTYAGRWTMGVRKGVQLLWNGQSNAGNMLTGYTAGTSAAWLLAQGVAWHLGALAYAVCGYAAGGSETAYTCKGGHAIYPTRLPVGTGTIQIAGSFLNDPGDGSDPAGWSLGTPDGVGVQNWLAEQSAADLADIAAIIWPWSETDSTRQYSEKAFYKDAALNWLGQLRALAGKTAAQLPLVWWNAMPFWTDPGVQMVREVAKEIAAVPGNNTVIGWLNVSDNDLASDHSHITQPGLLQAAVRAAPVVARAIAAAGGADALTIPPGLPVVGGPQIVSAYQVDSTHYRVKVAHDAGNALVLNGSASSGTGWLMLDGTTPATAGTANEIAATAVSVIDATHLLVTLARAPVSALSSCLLYYGFGSNVIGLGNGVTDNYASLTPPAGWDIVSDMNNLSGQSWTMNYPLGVSAAGTTPTTTPN